MSSKRENATTLSLISIYEIGKILNSSLKLEKTLGEVLNILASYLQMQRGTICLVNAAGQLEVVAALGLTHEAMRAESLRLGQGVTGRVLSSGMPIVIPDITEEPLLAEGDRGALLDGEVLSYIGVPIKATDKAFGVVSIARIWDLDDSGAVNFESDVRFLTMVAGLIGQAVRLNQHVATERERMMLEKHRLQKAVQGEPDPGKFTLSNVIGISRRMQDVYAEIHQIAPSRSTVLLRGESGTGKELIARAVHHLSTRKAGPFIKVNCAALPETLLESELFGHEKGAFTGATQDRKGRFELAHNGTLFLDEIGEISASFQAKLLRVLQEGEFERVGGSRTVKVDVRIVAATNRNLEEAVSKGDFRADLYYRINVVPIFLPALRERKDDIPLLAEHFLDRFNAENKRQVILSSDAMDVLMNCYFPGNVRELENCVLRLATMARSDVVHDIDLACQKGLCLSATLWKHKTSGIASGGIAPCAPNSACVNPSCGERATASSAASAAFDGESLGGLDDLPPGTQRDRLLRAMETAGWVQAKAARILGLSPRQVGYALRKYNIEVKRM